MNSTAEELNGDAPATQADLGILAGEMSLRFETLEVRMNQRFDAADKRSAALEERVDRIERGQTAILQVVESIDARLKEWGDVPERLARLERTVYRR